MASRLHELQAAAEHATRGDHAAALTALRAAWSDAPHPAFVSLARALLEASGIEPVTARTEVATQNAWLALAAGHDALPRLVKTPWPRLTSAGKARMKALLAREPDLLVDVAIGHVALGRFYESYDGDALVRLGLTALFTRKDPFAPVLLEQLKQAPTVGFIDEPRERKLDGLSRRVAAEAKPLSTAELAALARLEGSLTRPISHLESLLAAIFQKPDDDGARAVYADALTEASDPRGEFITLQLMKGKRTKAMVAREKHLLREHESHWLGALAPLLLTTHLAPAVFTRGFVSSATLVGPQSVAAFVALPQSATVEVLDVRGGTFEFHENLKALRVLENVGAFGRSPLPPLESLSVETSVDLSQAPLSVLRALEVNADFGQTLELDELTARLGRAPWAQSLERLRLPAALFLPSLFTALAKLNAVHVTLDGYWQCVLTRDGVLTMLPTRREDPQAVQRLVAAIEQVARIGELTALRFEDRLRALDAKGRQLLGDVVRRVLEKAGVTTALSVFEP